MEETTRQRRRRIIIVGDSITHGGEGDYTWRYRLWQWFQSQNIAADFVGPYTGVCARTLPTAPQPPRFPDEPLPLPPPRLAWGYAKDVSSDFDCRHFSTSGYQAKQAKEVIAQVVRAAEPTMMLLMLGFNDIGWWVDDAKGTFESIKAIVDRAREVVPEMEFAVSNVVNRTFVDGRDDLVEKTEKLNEMLKEAIPTWSTKQSPISHVDVASIYEAGPEYGHKAPAVFDGLHPNALGEYEIAEAFSHTLHKDFGLGKKPLDLPAAMPKRDLSPPSKVTMRGSPMGLCITWDHVFGAEYGYRLRPKGASEWRLGQPLQTNRVDISDVQPWTEYEFEVRSRHGYDHGKWSATYSAYATRQGAPPPRNIKTYPTETGFRITWDPPEGNWNIDRYEVLWYDENVGGFPSSQGARHPQSEVRNLPPGHRIQVSMRTWARFADGFVAGGEFSGARPVRVGTAALDRPTKLWARIINSNSVELTWKGSPAAAGYLFYQRDLRQAGSAAMTDGMVLSAASHIASGLFEGAWSYELSVSAMNGETESARSAAVIPENTGGCD